MLSWDNVGERYFEVGVKHCVLYPYVNGEYQKGVPWSGIISVTESPSGGEVRPLYANDDTYLEQEGKEEFRATIEAYTYPDEFARCDGSVSLGPGLDMWNQPRQKFGLVYETSIGNDTEGNSLGYKIHILYGCRVTPTNKNYKTTGRETDPITFSWNITATPVEIPIINSIPEFLPRQFNSYSHWYGMLNSHQPGEHRYLLRDVPIINGVEKFVWMDSDRAIKIVGTINDPTLSTLVDYTYAEHLYKKLFNNVTFGKSSHMTIDSRMFDNAEPAVRNRLLHLEEFLFGINCEPFSLRRNYKVGDFCTYNGNTYVCVKNVIGGLDINGNPASSEFRYPDWHLLSTFPPFYSLHSGTQNVQRIQYQEGPWSERYGGNNTCYTGLPYNSGPRLPSPIEIVAILNGADFSREEFDFESPSRPDIPDIFQPIFDDDEEEEPVYEITDD